MTTKRWFLKKFFVIINKKIVTAAYSLPELIDTVLEERDPYSNNSSSKNCFKLSDSRELPSPPKFDGRSTESMNS